MTVPAEYTTPLKSRAKIANYLMNRRSRSYQDHGHLLFVFNVKVYSPDLDFDHLLAIHAKSGYGEGKVNDAYWIEEARQRHAETDEDHLLEWALEDAGRLVTDSDCYKYLFDGTAVEAEFAFVGRSGGWIALTEFEGITMTDPENLRCLFMGDDEDGSPTMSYETLHRLYALVRMLEHDLTQEKAQAEVEFQAAFGFFANICGDIPTADVLLGAGI
jgi:hypothetical protein